jgi:putative endonuclease
LWYLYVLRCGDGSFYTGITNDVARRLADHQAGRGSRYTRAHLPVTVAALWRYDDRGAATQAEAAFKKLRRSTKQAFVETRASFSGAPFAFDVLVDLQAQV